MKQIKPAVQQRVTIVTKNPFTGTMVSFCRFTEDLTQDEIYSMVLKELKLMQFDYSNFDWENWVKSKATEGWKKRKVMNLVNKHFELSKEDSEYFDKLLARNGLIKVSVVE